MNTRRLAAIAAILAASIVGPRASAQEQRWMLQFGTPGLDFVSALAPAGADRVFVSGSTDGALGGPGAGGLDGWLAMYDEAGAQLWIQQFGTAFTETAWALCPDTEGGVFVAGYTQGDLGGPNAGSSDVWLARYDSAGNRAWIIQFGSGAIDEPRALAPDGAGGVFIAGRTEGDLDGGNAGGSDAWLARYDQSGGRVWIRQFGTAGSEWATALADDAEGGLFVAGWTTGDLGGGNVGSADIWVSR